MRPVGLTATVRLTSERLGAEPCAADQATWTCAEAIEDKERTMQERSSMSSDLSADRTSAGPSRSLRGGGSTRMESTVAARSCVVAGESGLRVLVRGALALSAA